MKAPVKRNLSWTAVILVITVGGLSMTQGCAATEVFYLDVKEGACYRYADDDHAVEDGDYKQLETVGCRQPHHLQVIDVVDVPYVDVGTSKAGGSAAGDDIYKALESITDQLNTQVVRAYCKKAYEDHLGVEPPAIATPGATYLRWFYPDPGEERRRYAGTTVCFVHKGYQSYQLVEGDIK